MRSPLAVLAAAVLAAACAPAYREAPASDPPPTYEIFPSGGETVVGRVGPDGTFRADTLAGVRADTARFERETVMTGTIRSDRRSEGPPLAVGYRVQVFAARDRDAAAAFARELEGRLEGEPVYVERVEPWWKVRVGDFRSREEAERLRDRLLAAGIEGAWTVRTTIRTAP